MQIADLQRQVDSLSGNSGPAATASGPKPRKKG
jgi:hypothetical protein